MKVTMDEFVFVQRVRRRIAWLFNGPCEAAETGCTLNNNAFGLTN